ncbi:MAG: hypothetical protein JW953_01315 [Anaerolineae bacterium]|nr:hypothetical protein [Anaerolineae bacterium]
MTHSAHRQAMFQGLVYDENDVVVETTFIGAEPHYVVLDDDFKRHIPAEVVDRQVVEWIQRQALASKELVTEQIMHMLNQDDLFTKAMIDSSLGNMDRLMEQGLPDDARMMLGMMGFKVVINVHGELVKLDVPNQEPPPDEEEW